MLIYIFLLSFMLLISFLELTNIDNRMKRILFLLVASVCLLLATIRWCTGPDWFPYYYFFTSNKTLSAFINDDYNFEFGYALLNYCVKSLSDNYSLLLFIISFAVIGLKYRIIWKLTPFPLLALMINFVDCNGDIFSVRQFISIAITLYAADSIIKRKFFTFMLYILIAAQFHTSAYVFILAYFVYGIRLNKTKVYIGVLSIFLLIGVAHYLSNNLMILISIMSNTDYLMGKFASYQTELEDSSSGTALMIGALRRAILLPILFYFRNNISKEYSLFNGFLNIYVVGIMIFVVFSQISQTIAGRLSFYFSLYEVFLIPSIIMYSNNLYVRITFFFVACIYFVIKYIVGFIFLPDYFIPFKTIFT